MMGPALNGLATALVHFLWQGCLLGLLLAALAPLLRRLPASARYAVLYGALMSAPVMVSIRR